MADKVKTTFRARAVSTIIQYQKRNQINSLTIAGDDRLADFVIEGNNNVTIYFNNDGTKENVLEALNELIEITHGANGTDEKTGLLVPHDELKIDSIELVDDTSNSLAEISYNYEGEHPNIEKQAMLRLMHDIDKLDAIRIELPNKDMKPLLEYRKTTEEEDDKEITVAVLTVNQDEWKADTIVTKTPDLLEITEHYEELPDADRKYTELNLKLPLFWYTWGEYYDYVCIYALGDTSEKYEGYASFLEETIEGSYDEEKNRTMYIFGVNNDGYEYNPHISLQEKGGGQEVYRVIARSADFDQQLPFAPDFIKGNFNEDGMNIPNQIAELKDQFESEIKVITWSWSISSFQIFTKGDTTNTAYGYFVSYNSEWGTERFTGVYYDSLDTTVYTLTIPDGVVFKNLALSLGNYQHNAEYWTQPIYRADWAQTNVKAPDFIDNKPLSTNREQASLHVSIENSTMYLYYNEVVSFKVVVVINRPGGSSKDIELQPSTSAGKTQYMYDLVPDDILNGSQIMVFDKDDNLIDRVYYYQSDWEETNTQSPSFILNKPNISDQINTTDFPLIRYFDYRDHTIEIRLEGDTSKIFRVRGMDTDINGTYNSSQNLTVYTMDFSTWSPFTSDYISISKQGSGLILWRYSFANGRPNWNETDNKAVGFIQNKPDLTQYVLEADHQEDFTNIQSLISDIQDRLTALENK